MPSSELPYSPIGKDRSEDRATAAILAGGGADGVPAFALRYWSNRGGAAMPVFITWLPGIGRFCLTVKYGRYSLRGRDWCIETGPGLQGAQSPLDQAQLEAMRVGQVLQIRLNRIAPVSPALAIPDMERDRRIERIAHQSRVPLFWDLERCTAMLAEAATDAHFRQPLQRTLVLDEISALLEDPGYVSVGTSRRFRSVSQRQ